MMSGINALDPQVQIFRHDGEALTQGRGFDHNYVQDERPGSMDIYLDINMPAHQKKRPNEGISPSQETKLLLPLPSHPPHPHRHAHHPEHFPFEQLIQLQEHHKHQQFVPHPIKTHTNSSSVHIIQQHRSTKRFIHTCPGLIKRKQRR
jgi:hypothetical protein